MTPTRDEVLDFIRHEASQLQVGQKLIVERLSSVPEPGYQITIEHVEWPKSYLKGPPV